MFSEKVRDIQTDMVTYIKTLNDPAKPSETNNRPVIELKDGYPVMPKLEDITTLKKTALEEIIRCFLNAHYRGSSILELSLCRLIYKRG